MLFAYSLFTLCYRDAMFKSGRDKWPATTATIFKVEWIESGDGPSYYDVTYSYRVGDEIHAGEFQDHGVANEHYFKRNDEFQIRYNPRKPSESYYPNVRNPNEFMRIFMIAMTAMCLAVALISFLVRTLSGDR